MAEYKFRALQRNGKVVRGKMPANNKHQLITKLKEAKLQPVAIKKLKNHNNKGKQKKTVTDITINAKLNLNKDFKKITLKDLANTEFHPFTKVKTKDVIAFVNNLYILKKASFNNIQALESLYEGTENPAFKDVIEDLLIGVQAGERLNTVMENYPKIFPPMFVNFVKVGEESGTLDNALLHARDYVESSIKLKKKIKSVLIPRILQFVGIMIMLFVCVIFGVPVIQNVYDMFDSKAEIPAATLAALNIANWLMANWYLPVGIILAIIGGFIFYISTPRGRYSFDRFLMKVPVVGDLISNLTISKFFQAMLLNLRNGMRIQESLDISKDVTNNYYFLSIVEVAKNNSLIGESWITPFEERGVFKPMVTEMVTIGMKTDLAEMMDKVNEYIGTEIDESIDRFTKWLPEVTYIFVGIALIAFVIVVMIPLTQVYMGSFLMM